MNNKMWANRKKKKGGKGTNNKVRALVSPLTVSNYALFVCCERGSQRWRRERQATTLSLHLLAVKSRLLSLLQRELRQISVKSGRYHRNGQETGEVTVCQRIPPKLRAIWQGLVRWGSWVATFTSMHNTPTIKTLLCVRHDIRKKLSCYSRPVWRLIMLIYLLSK